MEQVFSPYFFFKFFVTHAAAPRCFPHRVKKHSTAKRSRICGSSLCFRDGERMQQTGGTKQTGTARQNGSERRAGASGCRAHGQAEQDARGSRFSRAGRAAMPETAHGRRKGIGSGARGQAGRDARGRYGAAMKPGRLAFQIRRIRQNTNKVYEIDGCIFSVVIVK